MPCTGTGESGQADKDIFVFYAEGNSPPVQLGKNGRIKPTCPAVESKCIFTEQGNGFVRFRCSGYPDCKQYHKTKIPVINDEINSFEKKYKPEKLFQILGG